MLLSLRQLVAELKMQRFQKFLPPTLTTETSLKTFWKEAFNSVLD